MIVKEGEAYTCIVRFYVQREIVVGLRLHLFVYKMKLRGASGA